MGKSSKEKEEKVSSGKFTMFDGFRTWSLLTYGDSGKTKTVTRKKYDRIVKTLDGEDVSNENSKFRFWVKAKGFKLDKLPDNPQVRALFVPTKNLVST